MKSVKIYFNPNFCEDGITMIKDSAFVPKVTNKWGIFVTEATDDCFLDGIFSWGQNNINLPRSISVGDLIVIKNDKSRKKDIEGCFLVCPEGFKSVVLDLN